MLISKREWITVVYIISEKVETIKPANKKSIGK